MLLQGLWGGSFQLGLAWCVCRAHSWWPGGAELGVCWCPSEASVGLNSCHQLSPCHRGSLVHYRRLIVAFLLCAWATQLPWVPGLSSGQGSPLAAWHSPSPAATLGSRSSFQPCKGGLGSVLWVPSKLFLVLQGEGELGSAGAPRPLLRCHRTSSPPPGLWGHHAGCCACLQRRWRQICQLSFGWCP